MHLHIDLGSRTPIYVQIIECVKNGIASGELSAGTKLPPVRRLAHELSVSKLTVFRAYAELQEAGLVTGRPGQGTMIAPLQEHALSELGRISNRQSSAVVEFHDKTTQGHGRNFSVSGPDPELFDYQKWLDNIATMKGQGAWNFFVPNDLGQSEMIQAGVELLRPHRADVDESEIVVIGRGREIASRINQGLAPKGSHVLIQEPHNLGAEEMFTDFGFVPHGVAVFDQGIDLDHIELLVRTHAIKVAFVEPTFGSGDGKVWPVANRKAFLRLMHKQGITVVERLASTEISFVDDLPPTLANLAPQCDVISELPFSETFAPGIGIGVAAIPATLMPWFRRSRRNTGITVDVLTQFAAAKMVMSEQYREHFERTIPIYRARRDTLVRSLWKEAPFVKVNVPAGGLSLEITLPKSVDPHALFRETLAAGSPIVPGRFLTTRGRGSRTARISYGLMTPEMIHTAVQNISPVLRSFVEPAEKSGTI